MRKAMTLFAWLALFTVGCKKAPPAVPPTQAADSAQKPGDATAPAAAMATPGATGRPAAKAANVQGMKAYKVKDYVAAAEKFRAAIAADPTFALPHYNLACVAALTGDKKTALAELEWLANSSDPQAKRTLLKASHDSDLRSLEADPQAQKILKWGMFPGYRALTVEEETTPADAKRLVKASGGHTDACDGDESVFTVTRAVKGELAADRPGAETLLVSLADGAVLFDAAGKVVAKGDALDGECVGSQAGLMGVSLGQLVPDDEPEIVIHYASGGRGSFSEQLEVLKRRGDKLVSILTLVLGSYERTQGDDDDAMDEKQETSKLSLDAPGVVSYKEGKQKAKTLRWDPKAFKFQ